MEHREGETLASLLRRGPLDLETAIRYASDIGDALDAAHTRGLAPSNLAPANVLITPAGAHLLDAGAMPQPRSTGADVRADIFSFGALFYEMLTGRQPLVAAADPPAPSRLNTAVPPAIDAVVARCLAKTPDERWPTVRAMLNALTVALSESRTRPLPVWRYAAVTAAAALIVVAAACPR